MPNYSFGDILAGRVPGQQPLPPYEETSSPERIAAAREYQASLNDPVKQRADFEQFLINSFGTNQITGPALTSAGKSVESGNVGPGGITPGSYKAEHISQAQRQWLWNFFGHSGTAPTGYGGESGTNTASTSSVSPTTTSASTTNVNTSQVTPTPVTPQSSAENLINTISNEYQKKLDEYNKKFSDFEKANPFVFEKILEEESAKVSQRLDPYYTQTLNDYLTGINTKRRRSSEDERTLLTELNADTSAYEGRNKMALTDALNKSAEGFADVGLLGSGQSLREQGKLTAESGRGLSDFLRGQERRKVGIEKTSSRLGEDLNLEESLRRRDIERERQAQTQSQALTGVNQRRGQRQFEEAQVVGAPPGVNPLQYLNQSYGYLG